jgi:hypothetical protein
MKEECICFKDCFRLGKVHQECLKYLKQVLVAMANGENRFLSGFILSDTGETSVEGCEHLGSPFTDHTDK